APVATTSLTRRGPRAETTAVDETGRRGALRPGVLAGATLAALTLVWIVVFSVLVHLRQSRLWTVDYDMGIHDQSVWLLAHFRGFSTIRGLQVFGHHATVGYLLYVPFSWLGAGVDFLNISQVVIAALGVVPVFLL